MKPTESGKSTSINYVGPSMNPTLKAGDELYSVGYKGGEIRPGDVILFVPPGGESQVVHRVIYIDSKGIRTRGDNNNQIDPWLLSPDQILGRVICAKRGGGRRKVFGGRKGQLIAVTVRAIRVVDSCLSSFLRLAYLRLAETGILRRWLPARMKTRVISYIRPSGTELQLLMGRRVIGRKRPGQSRWNIRRPFRLFVDEAYLSNLSVDRRSLARHSRAGDDALSFVNQDNEVL
jgi:signal peptidase